MGVGTTDTGQRFPGGLAVFVTVFATYACTASPAIGWLDSPEFVAAGATLGVAHSPGHPLAGLLGRLATLCPIGDIAVRVNLLSSLCGAAAALAMFAATRAVVRRAGPGLGEIPGQLASAATALLFAFSWAAWFQGVRAEVYSLQAALLVGVVAAVIEVDNRLAASTNPDRGTPRLLLAGLLLGLALGHHHLTALLVLVPAGLAILVRRRSERISLRAGGATALLGFLGLATLAYLPVRGASNALLNWGAPATAGRFAWTVSARAFHKATTVQQTSSRTEDAGQVAGALIEQVTPLMVALALMGLYLGLRSRSHRRLVALLAGVAGLACVGRVAVGFEPSTPDHLAYLLPAVAAVLLLGVAGLAQLAELLGTTSERARRPAAWCCGLLLAALVPWQIATHAEASSLRTAYGSNELARAELTELPPRTLLLLSYFQTSFRVTALQAMDGARPDIVVLDRSFLTYPGHAAVARARYPELAALIDAPLRAGAPTPVAALSQLAQTRPVAVQLHVNLDARANPYLIPHGLYAEFATTEVPERSRPALELRDDQTRLELQRTMRFADTADQDGIAATLLWNDFLRTRFYCYLGRYDAANISARRAWDLAPGDPALQALTEQCYLQLSWSQKP